MGAGGEGDRVPDVAAACTGTISRTRKPLTAADLAIYSALFVNAFVAATPVPLPSEPLLVGLIVSHAADPVWLLAVATAGNTLGTTINWAIGHGIARFRDRPWFPATPERYEAACRSFARYGLWSLLLAWLPFIGDPLTVAAGALRVPLGRFLMLIALGKAARYATLIAGVGWWAE